jgi:hypothetical protein
VSNSSTEAEYVALSLAAMEAAWLRQVFLELGHNRPDITTVYIHGDNQGSLALSENPEIHQRTKHIAIKHHYIREQVAQGNISLSYVSTHDQVADGFTKVLGHTKFSKFVRDLRLRSIEVRSITAEGLETTE